MSIPRVPCPKCNSRDTWFEKTDNYVSFPGPAGGQAKRATLRCRCGLFKIVDFEATVGAFLQEQRAQKAAKAAEEEARRKAEAARLAEEAERLEELRKKEALQATQCACPGCSETPSGASKYCSDRCRKRFSYLKKKAA